MSAPTNPPTPRAGCASEPVSPKFQILTDADPDPRDIIESCSPKCLRDVLTDRGLALMASDGDFAIDCYECRECGSWCLRHEVEP